MDGGIIASFKAQYKRRFIRLAIERDNQGIENMYKIDQLQGMKIAADAWAAVSRKTIYNCWNHVGLVPPSHLPPPPPAPEVFFPPHADYAHPPQPTWDNYVPEEMYLHPDLQQAIAHVDEGLLTEHYWTDQEIVDQIIAEREEGFLPEHVEDYDLEDFYQHQN
jgi:hypothetical protein